LERLRQGDLVLKQNSTVRMWAIDSNPNPDETNGK
jgi:hypothetical protein